MPKGRGNGKGAPGKRTGTPRSMNKPAMMDWALRLLRLLNERKVLNSRIVAEEFDVNIRTAQRYLLYLSDLPCVVVDEEQHTYSLTVVQGMMDLEAGRELSLADVRKRLDLS